MSDLGSVALWWLALSAVSVACAPVVWWAGAGLGSARYALLRPVGLVLATAVVWWPAALFGLPFERLWLVVGITALGAIGWTIFLRWESLGSIELRPLVAFELVWLATFLGYLLFRSYNSDIINTEKPMEIALLSSISRSSDVPAPDPWFAGEPINYYYFGYQTFATLIKLTGIAPTVAFNFGLATAFASAASIASGLGYRVARLARVRTSFAAATGALAAILLLIAGNLETFLRLAANPSKTINAGWWDGVGWQASRIIYDTGVHGDPNPAQTINEFPAFSFVLGDLHPHVVTYPALLAVVALAAGFVLAPAMATRGRFLLCGGLAGLLYASNSWDAPVGIVVLVGSALLATGIRSRTTWEHAAAALLGTALAAFPFALHYTAPVGIDSGDVPDWLARIPVLGTITNTLAVVTWRPSSTADLLTVHGVWIGAFILFAAWALQSDGGVLLRVRRFQEVWVVALLLCLAIGFAWAPAVPLLGIPAALSLAIAIWDDRRPARLVAGLFCAGCSLALIPEFLYIQDPFGNRMNTVFKLYFQAWLFLSIASACGLAIAIAGFRLRARWLTVAAGAVLVVVAIPYAPLSADDWIAMGSGTRTLDGAAYIQREAPAEAAAIEWLRDNSSDGDILVESPGCGYRNVNGIPMNRYSAFTGVPTVIGWANHEGQWRRGESANIYEIMQQRQAAANLWLDGENPPKDGYPAPRFLMLGPQETEGAANCDLLQSRDPEIDAMLQDAGWQSVFEQDGTRIFVRESDPIAVASN